MNQKYAESWSASIFQSAKEDKESAVGLSYGQKTDLVRVTSFTERHSLDKKTFEWIEDTERIKI